MAEIITKGNTNTNIKKVCDHCGCYFSYKKYEIYKNRKHYIVFCPDCFSANIVNKKEDQ